MIRAVVLVGVTRNGSSRDLLTGELVSADDTLLVTKALLGRRGRRVNNPRKGVRGLVGLAAAGALVPVRVAIGEPRVLHGLVLANALDRHLHVTLDVLDGELAAVVERHGVFVDLNNVGRGVGEVAVLDADSKSSEAVPVKLGRVSRELVADLFGGQRHGELTACGNRDLSRGRSFVVVIGAVAHFVRARGKAAELGHAFGHSLILARVLGAPLHGGVDSRDLAVSLGADGLGHTLNHRCALGRLLDRELARQARCRQLVVALVDARQLSDGRRMFAGLDRAAVDVRTELIVTDDVAEVRLGAVLLAVVGELSGGVPFHGELALIDSERAGLERNLVVGVGALGLRRRHGVAALAHGLAALAGDGDVLEGLALDELALGDLPAQSGINVAVRLEGVQSGNRDRERGDLECHLALDRLAVDRDVIVDRHLAGVLDARSNVRPAAVGGLVLNDGTLGQLRGIDKVLLAVVLAGVALNSQGGDFDRARLMAAYGARTVLGAGLGNRRQLVGRPIVRMLGVHLNLTGLRVVGRILSHDFMLGADIAFSSLNRIPAVLISLELFTVIGNRHRLVAVIEHVKRNALAIGIACIEVINGGRIGVYVGIGLCVIPLIAANPADLLTNAIGLRRGGHNDLVLPSAVLPYLSLLAVLANLKVRSFIALLPGSIIGNRVRAPLDLNLGIGRRIVVVILGIAYIVSTCQKPGQLAVRRYLLVFPTRPATIFHRLGHARDGTVLAAARSPIIAHKPSRRVLIGLGNLHGRFARNGQVVRGRHAIMGRILGCIAIGRLVRRPITAVFTVLDLHIRRNGVILNVDRNAVLFAIIGAIKASDLEVETRNVNDLPRELKALGIVALAINVALILARLGLDQVSGQLKVCPLYELNLLAGTVSERCARNDRPMLFLIVGVFTVILEGELETTLIVLI